MSVHLATTQTQVDIKDEVEGIIRDELHNILHNDLNGHIILVDQHSDDREVELKFNWIIYSLTVQISAFLDKSEIKSDKTSLEGTIVQIQRRLFKIVTRHLAQEIGYSLGEMFGAIHAYHGEDLKGCVES